MLFQSMRFRQRLSITVPKSPGMRLMLKHSILIDGF